MPLPMHGMSCATEPSTRSPSATAPAPNARFRRKTSTCSRCNRAMWIQHLLRPQALGAPPERLERTRPVLPEIHPNAQGRTGLQSLLAHVAHLQPIRVAVVHPCDSPSLSAALEARHAGLIEPVLVGPQARLEAV